MRAEGDENADRALYELEACIVMQPSNIQECYRSSIILYAIPDPIGIYSFSRRITIIILYRRSFAGQKKCLAQVPLFNYPLILCLSGLECRARSMSLLPTVECEVLNAIIRDLLCLYDDIPGVECE